MGYNFFIIGGDKRILYLAQDLKEEKNNIKLYGFDKLFDNEEIFEDDDFKMAKSLNEIDKNDIIISAFPMSFDAKNIYAPFAKEDKIIKLDELEKILKDENHILFAGKIPDKIKKQNENKKEKQNEKKEQTENQNENAKEEQEQTEKKKEDPKEEQNEKKIQNQTGIYDFYDDEKITILSTISTAEGAIAKAIEETEISLDDANVLVLGFGRVGKMLASKLHAMNANVYVEARKERDLAWIKALGYNSIPLTKLNENLCKMDIIFNTVPAMILDKEKLILLNRKILIIDLASKPGGVDFETCKRMKFNASLYSGIPGKVAPRTVATYLKDYIMDKIK